MESRDNTRHDQELLNVQNDIYNTLQILVEFTEKIKDRKWSLGEKKEFNAFLQNLVQLEEQLEKAEEF